MTAVRRRQAFPILVVIGLISFLRVAATQTWRVDASVSSPGDGTSWGTAFKTIQQGIDAASHGDTVIVAEGTYVENIRFDGKNIVLTSTDPLDPQIVEKTIVDGNSSGSVVTFTGTENYLCALSGFTIRNGTAEAGAGICGGTDEQHTHAMIRNNAIISNSGQVGGGMAYCSGPIRGNRITENSADRHGGGLYRCHGTIYHNIIRDNSAARWGGGLHCCDGVIRHNTICANSANIGAGIYDCGRTIQDNIIFDNLANLSGGGLAECDATMRGNIITRNSTVGNGGGFVRCDGPVLNNVIVGNSAGTEAGGLYCCHGRIQNNVIVGNSAGSEGGAMSDCQGWIYNNTICRNSAAQSGGALARCEAVVKNCIIWGNTAASAAQIHMGTLPTYSCVENFDEPAEHTIMDDPLFIGYPFGAGAWTSSPALDEAARQTTLMDTGASWQPGSLKGLSLNPDTSQLLHFVIASNTATSLSLWGDASDVAGAGGAYEIYDYRLQSTSPCIDTGDTSIDVGRFDLDGDHRYVTSTEKPGWRQRVIYIDKEADGAVTLIWKGFTDMGAYECQVQAPVPETFSVQTRQRMESGDWVDVFTDKVSMWTDEQPTGRQKFYRVEMK